MLQQWFREDGGFRYDQAQAASAGSGDADLLAFLDDRSGYCKQFAAAMAIMARVIGIPSRVAVGFLEPEKATNGAWVFSAHDLHAWPELYFPGSGWVRFEPTPQARAGDRSRTTPRPSSRRSPRRPSPSASRVDRAAARARREPERRRRVRRRGHLLDPVGAAPGRDPRPRGRGAAAPDPPSGARTARRRRRLAGDIEDLWVELRDVARDLGHAWPVGRSPRRAGEWLGRLLAAPVAGSRARRPSAPRPRPGTGGRRRPRPPRARPRAQPLLPRPRDLHRRAVRAATPPLVEEALAAGVTPREVRRASWWPASVVGRRTSWRPRQPRTDRRPGRPSTTRPAGRSTSSSADRALRARQTTSTGHFVPVSEVTGHSCPSGDPTERRARQR